MTKYLELKEKREKNTDSDVFKIKEPFNKDDVLEEDDDETDV